ncbi:MAG: hypothetical protein KA797_03100 [Chitinophagales bacterium]|nr:hypothetical protein [Chitinophagales bacterium]
MKKLRTLIFIIALLLSNFAFAHKDRIERPEIYLFYFGKERVEIKSSEVEKLNSYYDSISSRRKQITRAEFFFKTKEIVSISFKDYKCFEIEISSKKRSLFVPKNTVKKISSVNLKTVCLLWSNGNKEAFDSGYFFIRFSLEKDELPFLQLFFEDQKFSEAIIWNKSGENSMQWKKF